MQISIDSPCLKIMSFKNGDNPLAMRVKINRPIGHHKTVEDYILTER